MLEASAPIEAFPVDKAGRNRLRLLFTHALQLSCKGVGRAQPSSNVNTMPVEVAEEVLDEETFEKLARDLRGSS